MASPLNLLTLPREIRDKIYSYLHKVIHMPWQLTGEYKKTTYCVMFPVQFDNFPLHAILLTSHRLHNEYLESSALSMTIRAPVSERVSFTGDLLTRTKQILQHVRYATVFQTLELAAPIPEFDPWVPMETLFSHISSTAPKLCSLRVAMRYAHREINGAVDAWDGLEYDALIDGAHTLNDPPHTFCDLSLTGFTQCLLLEDALRSTEINSLVYFVFRTVGLSLWTRGDAEKVFWRREEIMKEWPLGDLNDSRNGLADDERKRLSRYRSEMLRVRDRFGVRGLE